MATSLGIDTGGTYTDAVIFDDERGVIAKAKALTTRHELTIGIAEAVGAVLSRAGVAAQHIGLVSLSTTLATNALVEGRGGRVGLVFIGFDDADVTRSGLSAALDGDPVIRVSGGHDSHGDARAALDLADLERQLVAVAPGVTAFAVSAHFGTRNPAHELAARDLIERCTGLPATCGHELSAKLDGPRRALTSVLNARLIGLIANLISSAEQIMHHHEIVAPLMVVRGDGALMAAAVAKARPIETILSGPAASVVGAAYLTDVSDAIISDIGGTTTDVAVIRDGAPRLDTDGAVVGGMRTMVEAVAMTTVGLGGDSEVSIVATTLAPRIELGPRRVVPLCLVAGDHADVVHSTLERQLAHELPGEHDGRFVLATGDGGASTSGLSSQEAELLGAVRGISPLDRVLRGRGDAQRLHTLVRRGLAMIAAFTPTDAAHVLELDPRFDATAAAKGAALMARRRSALGRPVAADGHVFSAAVISLVRQRSAETLLDVAFAIDGFAGTTLSRHELVAASLHRRVGVVQMSAQLTLPVVGLGASAALYYPAVAELLRTNCIVPDDADVANAIGAVVGQVRCHADVYVSQPERGRFRVHHPGASADVFDVAEALALARSIALAQAHEAAVAAGAALLETHAHEVVNIAHMEGEDYFVDATVTAVASGRPAAAR